MKTWAPFAAVAFGGLILLLFLSEPASDWLARLVMGDGSNQTVVAKLVSLDGEVKRISNGQETSLMGPLSSPLTFQNADRLELSKNSTGVLVLNSQDELKVSGSSNLIFQLWNEGDPQTPLYVTVLQGKLESLKGGVRGRAYVVSDGRLYLPGQSAQPTRTTLILNRAEVDLNMGENQLEEVSEAGAGQSEEELKSNGPIPETLSNEYIDETIARRQVQMQKCWLNRVKENPVQKGKIVLQFEISRRGKVKDVKIIDTDLNDETLQNCITDVFERITFRSFKGAEISLSYPIQFE